MALTALAPTRVEAPGSFTTVVMGTAGGTSTSTVVTIPGVSSIQTVVVGGATSTTPPYCDTISANTFTVTHGNTDLFTYIALCKGGV